MTVVVTGAAGQLGRALCHVLGADATGLDRTALDITDKAAVRTVLEDRLPDAVINCAAYTAVDRAEENVEMAQLINVDAVRNLAEKCGDLGARLVHISTDYVFGSRHPAPAPYKERDTPDPHGVYATTKRDGEIEAAACPRHVVVRTCGLYGEGGNFVRTMLRLGRERDEVKVVNDQHCTPTPAGDVARAIAFLLEAHANGCYHVTSGGETTWFDFAKAIFEIAKLDVTVTPITTAEFGAAAPRPVYSVLDTSKYHALGGPAMPPWREALASYVRDQA